jgi:hypothetical protein
MIRCDSFARSAVFAALAAAAWLPWVLTAGPVLGWWPTQALYLVVVAACYVAGLPSGPAGGPPPHRLRAALLAALAGLGAALLAHSTTELALALAALLGVARSGFLYRAAPARALAGEAGLLLGGLLFARHLAAPTVFATALAVWGFLLVQSLFFLIGGVAPRRAAPARLDPFDDAHRRAEALLDRAV